MERELPWVLTDEIRQALELQQVEWDTQEQPTFADEAPELWAISLAPDIQCALTKKQREAILERDNHTSQMRHYSEEEGWHTGGYCEDGGEGCSHLAVHHIKPQREGGSDEPENLITLFECEHVGRCPSGKIRDNLAKKKQ